MSNNCVISKVQIMKSLYRKYSNSSIEGLINKLPASTSDHLKYQYSTILKVFAGLFLLQETIYIVFELTNINYEIA